MALHNVVNAWLTLLVIAVLTNLISFEGLVIFALGGYLMIQTPFKAFNPPY
ncbi:hypothetical protein HUU53_04790 [Candidatus Micrarchaeota archaeon]|nr:hypothetical protein [Candidatus Micrarchaeota archaeon]